MNVTPRLPDEILNKIFSLTEYKDQPLLRCCRDWDGYLRGIEQDSIRDLRTLAAETRTRLDPTLFADATSELETLSASSDLNLSLLRLRNLRTHLTTSFTAVFSDGVPYRVVEFLSEHRLKHRLPESMNAEIESITEFKRRLRSQEVQNQQVELFKDLKLSSFVINSIGVLLSTPRHIGNRKAIAQFVQNNFNNTWYDFKDRFTPIFLNSERVNFSKWARKINHIERNTDYSTARVLIHLSKERWNQLNASYDFSFSSHICCHCIESKKLSLLDKFWRFLDIDYLRIFFFDEFWQTNELKTAFELLKKQPAELFHTLCQAYPLDPICEPTIQEDKEIEQFMSSKIPVALRCSHAGVWLECHLLLANDKIEEAIRMSSKLVRPSLSRDMLITIVRRLVKKEDFNRALNLAETQPEISDLTYHYIYRRMLKVGDSRAPEIKEKISDMRDKQWFDHWESKYSSHDRINQQVGLFDYLLGHIKEGRLDVAVEKMSKLRIHMLQSEIHLTLATKFAEAHNFERAFEHADKAKDFSQSELENNRSLRFVTLTPDAHSQAYFNIYSEMVAVNHPEAAVVYSKISATRVTMPLVESFLVDDSAEMRTSAAPKRPLAPSRDEHAKKQKNNPNE